jgi:hypothetical protein
MLNPQVMIQKNWPWIKERLGDSPDESAFFRWQLHSLLRETGFTDIEITPLDWLHPLTPSGLVKYLDRIGLALEKIPILNEISGSLYIRASRPL